MGSSIKRELPFKGHGKEKTKFEAPVSSVKANAHYVFEILYNPYFRIFELKLACNTKVLMCEGSEWKRALWG